jgi:hypothetical protein
MPATECTERSKLLTQTSEANFRSNFKSNFRNDFAANFRRVFQKFAKAETDGNSKGA